VQTVRIGSPLVDLRVSVPLTRHIHRFNIPLPVSTERSLQNPDKEWLRAEILAMRASGISYRAIGALFGIHWTRVGQIVKEKHQFKVT
jgi:hypothetical protein